MDRLLSSQVDRRGAVRFGLSLFRRSSVGDTLVLPEPTTQPPRDPFQRFPLPSRPPRPPRRFSRPDWARIRRLALRAFLIGGAIAGIAWGGQWMAAQSAASDHYQRGRADYTQGDWRGAVAEATEELRLDPNDMNGLFLRSSAYFKLKEFRLAARDYRSQIALTSADDNADQAVNYQNLAYPEDYYGDHIQAIKDFTEAIALDPSIPDQPGWTADAHDDTGDSHKGRMWAYYETGQNRLALADCQALIARDPYPSSIAVRGKIYRHMGDYADAVRDFRTALRENPSLDFASNQLADLLGQMGRYADAILVVQAEARMHPRDSAVLANVGWWQYRAGALAAAEVTDKQALALGGHQPITLGNLALVYASQGNWTQARSPLLALLRIGGSSDLHGCLVDFQQALRVHPHLPALHQALAMLHTVHPMPKGNGPSANRRLAQS